MPPIPNLPGLMLDRSHPLARGLVGWWPMNEAAGRRVNDISGNENHGAWAGTTNTWTGGNLGQAINQTGASGGYVAVPSSTSLQVSNAMTACIWANRPSASVNGALFCKGNLANSYGDWCVVFDNSDTSYPDFRIAYPGSGLLVRSGTVAINAWHCVVATYDKVTARMYVNGRQTDAKAYTTAIPQTATPLNIGVYYAAAFTHAGRFAHARLYNRALSAVEVQQLYSDPLAGAQAFNIKRYWVAPSAPVTPPAPSKGNRIARWIYRAPTLLAPVGEWIRQRDDEEILFLG